MATSTSENAGLRRIHIRSRACTTVGTDWSTSGQASSEVTLAHLGRQEWCCRALCFGGHREERESRGDRGLSVHQRWQGMPPMQVGPLAHPLWRQHSITVRPRGMSERSLHAQAAMDALQVAKHVVSTCGRTIVCKPIVPNTSFALVCLRQVCCHCPSGRGRRSYSPSSQIKNVLRCGSATVRINSAISKWPGPERA